MTARSANSGNQKPQLDDNLLKLKKQYPQELSSLKTLFADWTESDLLTTLEEVQGDLDLAIGRISEGHAQQWGEITKKPKKEKKATIPDIAALIERPGQRPVRSNDYDASRPPRAGGFAGRGGRGGGRGGRGGGRGGSINGSFHPRPPRQSGPRPDTAHGITDGKAADAGQDDGWGAKPGEEWGAAPENEATEDANAGSGWGDAAPAISAAQQKPAAQVEAKSAAPQKLALAPPAPARPGPGSRTSWAQLVRGPEPAPPAPAPSATPAPAPAANPAPGKSEAPKQPIVKPSTAPSSPVKEEPAARQPSPARSPIRPPSPVKELSRPASPAKQQNEASSAAPSPAFKAIAKPAPARSPSPAKAPTPALAPAPAPGRPPAPATQTQSDALAQQAAAPIAKPAGPPGLKQARAPAPRKLKQEQAVVMPANLSASSLGVRFGSLGLGGNEEEEVTAPESIPQVAAQNAPSTAASAKPAYGDEQQPSEAAAAVSSASAQQPASHQAQLGQYQSQLHAHQQAQAGRGIPTQQQPVPQQQTLPKQTEALPFTQPGGALAHAAGLPGGVPPYGSHFPGYQHPAASAFGMGYGLPTEFAAMYSQTADHRAALMGYDPSHIYQGGSKYQTPDAYTASVSSQAQASPQQSTQQVQQSGQTTNQPAAQSQTQQPQSQQQPQQQYPMPNPYGYYNTGYYPYQYQNQFPANMYGGQFVNKNVYPGYQNTPASNAGGAAGAAQQPKTTVANQGNAYGYGTGAGGPHLYQQYEDLTGGLNDYKSASSMYGPGQGQQGQQSGGAGGYAGLGGFNQQQQGQKSAQQAQGAGEGFKQRPRSYNDKYQGQPSAAGGNAAGAGQQGSGQQSGQSQQSNATNYYNHHLAGLAQGAAGGQAGYQGGQNGYGGAYGGYGQQQMMHGYQGQPQGGPSAGLYGSAAGAAGASGGRGQQQYWNGQS